MQDAGVATAFGSALTIRRAQGSDAPAIASVLRNAFAEFETLYTPDAFAATCLPPSGIEQRMDEGPVWIAFVDDVIVGTVSIVSREGALYIRGMAVLPELRRRGTGRLLLKQVQDYALEHGHTQLELKTNPFLGSAIALYRGLGFEQTATEDFFGVASFTMVKQLISETMSWRRLDGPGHDVVRLQNVGPGWRLSGTATFEHEVGRCRLNYIIGCNNAWHTVETTVSGQIGTRPIDLTIVADEARSWRVNGIERSAVAGCLDVDLAFSPSTNLLPLRRLSLRQGETADIRAAWLRFPQLTLEPLDQVYRRIDATMYQYESAGGGYSAMLRTNASGFVTLYPGRWEAVESR